MKLKLILGCLLLLQSVSVVAQDHILFQKLEFDQAKEKAQLENKLIFLDAYTTWCAPCKWMEGNVFNKKDIADYFNAKFVNVKFDCEAGEGIEIARKYGVKSFPTYLFLDHHGTLIYRTQSRMEADQFLVQAKNANDINFQIPTLVAQYKGGARASGFLLRYIQVMSNVEAAAAEKAKKSLDSVANDAFLYSPEGWETIKMMARFNDDKYGSFFQKNKAYFKSISTPEDFIEKESQLLRNAMYSYIRDKNQEKFLDGLAYFEKLADPQFKIDVAMFRAEWAGTNESPKEFKRVTDILRKGVLKEQDEKLSFIARRFANAKLNGNTSQHLQQCYVLAKQAVKLNPDSYSNQGTFAEICIALKKKSEAVKAALAARALAEQETSKIIKLADALVDRAKSIQ